MVLFYTIQQCLTVLNYNHICSTRALIGTEACFYNCMETREISCLAKISIVKKRDPNYFGVKMTNKDRANERVDIGLS